jgi:hypothetical protein
MRSGALAALLASMSMCVSAPVAAQTPYERFSLDTTVGVDMFRGISVDGPYDNVSHQPQIVVDIVGTVQLANRWQIYVRPWFRLPRPAPPTAAVPEPATPPWDTMLYQASLRYERQGPIATRVDVGYIASPVGLGLFDANPRTNPTIAGHASYFTPMLPFDPGGPRPLAIASTYPLGGALTLSSVHWDARAAVVNSAPVRSWVLGASTNPSTTPAIDAGAGVTPITGLRLGVSFSHGSFAEPEELGANAVKGDRIVTLVGIEGDYSVRYTKLTGEFIRDWFSIPGRVAPARTWFIQGTQTLTARWSIAGRHEGTSAPIAGSGIIFAAQPHLLANEITAAYRATRQFTIKGSYYARQSYGRTTWDHQGGVQLVWQKRWW